MTRDVMSLPAGLTAVIVLLLLVHQTFGAYKDGDHDCATTSCGNIYNISYPFRLRDQPANCGHPRFNLSCDQDNQTVLYLFAGKYYVQEIDYSKQTIRVVDSGIQKDNYSSIPRYFLNFDNLEWSYYPYYLPTSTHAVAFLMCEKPMNFPGIYLNKSSCFKRGVFSSNSPNLTQPKLQGFAYVTYGWTKASDIVDESCQVEQIFWTSLLPDHDDQRNFSCTDYHNKLAYGFQLRWYGGYYDNCIYIRQRDVIYCSDRRDGSYNGLPKELFWLYKGFRGILRTLYWAIEDQKFLRLIDRGT